MAVVRALVGLLVGLALCLPAFMGRSLLAGVPGSRPFAPVAGTAAGTTARDLGPFRGLGTWVDAYDYAAAFQPNAGPPPVTPDSVGDMAALGVKTLYLQAAKADDRSPGPLVDTRLVGDFLVRAHRKGIKVVAWYLPLLDDVEGDFAHVQALEAFRAKGQRFDALALDAEWIQGVRDVTERNRRLIQLVSRTRALVGTAPLGVIVFPAVQLEVVNPILWPGFPYRDLAPDVDVWMPMAYWTFRTGAYRDPYLYTDESVRRLRADVGEQNAAVHPIGGIGDLSGVTDYAAFLRAVRDDHAVGWSIYDFNTVASSAWPRLRAGKLGVPQTASTTTTAAPASPTTRR
jgi:hypothetical protein